MDPSQNTYLRCMIRQTLAFLQSETDWQAQDKLLLAISGGVDSMVMLDICRKARDEGYIQGEIAVAHAHFGLREEADADAEFVRQTAQKLGLPYYEKRFETEVFAERKQISIQMAARQLRYLWFEQVLEDEGYDRLCTAHQLDDSLETALLNLIRQSGLKGLAGIPPQRGNILRPLLWAGRKEIEAYAKKQGILWREDSSNASTKYRRNALRLEVIPLLKNINPQLTKGFAKTSHHVREAEKIYRYAIEGFRQKLLIKRGNSWLIHQEEVLKTPAPETILYELLRKFHFSSDISRQALETAGHPSGGIFLSPTHEMLNDRKYWIIRPRSKAEEKNTFIIQRRQKQVVLPDGRCLKLEYSRELPAALGSTSNEAYLDTFSLDFPLLLRPWKPGDFFYPLGMRGRRKKIQDLLTDHKVDRFKKEKVMVLETSKKKIAWVVGYQIADWCKIKTKTKEVLHLIWQSGC